MDKSSIIKSVQGQDEEKVGFSLKLPKSLKEDLQSLCEEKSISMNALIVATMQALINDDCGKQLTVMKKLLLNYREERGKRIEELERQGVLRDNGVPEEIMEEYEEAHTTRSAIDKILGV
jgi:hypothetical protein